MSHPKIFQIRCPQFSYPQNVLHFTPDQAQISSVMTHPPICVKIIGTHNLLVLFMATKPSEDLPPSHLSLLFLCLLEFREIFLLLFSFSLHLITFLWGHIELNSWLAPDSATLGFHHGPNKKTSLWPFTLSLSTELNSDFLFLFFYSSNYFLTYLFWGYTKLYSGLSPDSMHKNHSWRDSKDCMWSQSLKPAWPSARQAPYRLYYLRLQSLLILLCCSRCIPFRMDDTKPTPNMIYSF